MKVSNGNDCLVKSEETLAIASLLTVMSDKFKHAHASIINRMSPDTFHMICLGALAY
jgi:hypothetical protein